METCRVDVETFYFPHPAFLLADDGGMLVAIGCGVRKQDAFTYKHSVV